MLRVCELTAASVPSRFEHVSSSSVLLALTLGDEDGGIVVTRDAFDSDLLCLEIARVLAARASSVESFVSLYTTAAERLRALGLQHLLRRVDAQDLVEVWALESSGFCLMDVGITLGRRLAGPIAPREYDDLLVHESTDDMMHRIAEAMVSRPWGSRYEADPDYSEHRVRELRTRWLWNSHHGRADVVFVGIIAAQPAGYVTCRVDPSSGHGEIELVGTLPAFRGRGVALRLVAHAIAWFSSRTDFVTVRTQATNYAAANLYEKCGLTLHRSDLTFRLSLNCASKGSP